MLKETDEIYKNIRRKLWINDFHDNDTLINAINQRNIKTGESIDDIVDDISRFFTKYFEGIRVEITSDKRKFE